MKITNSIISLEELEYIQVQFDKVIYHNYPINKINTDNLFREWYENKEIFISTFRDLIFETQEEISFTISSFQKQDEYKDISTRLQLFTEAPSKSVNSAVYSWFTKTVTPESLFENKTIKDYRFFDEKLQTFIKIPTGAKVLKSFKYFFEDKQLLREFQDECSMILQKNKIRGHLCLSVHPLDFLSLSENACNWDTCHSLQKEFAAGNLSLMTDPSTFIIYLKSGQNQIISNFPDDVLWNNKKWRVLGFLSQDFKMMFAGRQYPYPIDNVLENYIYDILKQSGLIGDNWIPWTREAYKAKNCGFCTNIMYPRGYENMVPLINFLKISTLALNFNDLLYSSDYHYPYWTAQYAQDGFLELDNEESVFEIGRPVKCLQCGNHYILDSEIMICRDCYGVKQNIPINILEKKMLKKENYYG